MAKKKRSVICIISIMLLIVLAGAAAGAMIWKSIQFEKNGKYISDSDTVPYEYTLYKDHVVLEKYMGSEEIVTIPETVEERPVTEIGEGCFKDNKEIVKVTLNEKTEKIGEWAFYQCMELEEVTGGNVSVISAHAFTRCSKLINAELGSNIQVISNGAFSGCTSLKKMLPQENLILLGDYAFADSALEEFSFNHSTEVGKGVFSGSAWIKNQKEDFVIYGDGGLVGYAGTDETVDIPNGVKTIIAGCFYDTTAKEIYVPDTVTEIQVPTFARCEGVKVYIPDSVTYIGDPVYQGWTILYDKYNTKVTIMTTQDSYAHKYAEENHIPYKIVEEW